MQTSNIRERVERYIDRDDLTTNVNEWMMDTRLDLALAHNFHHLYKEASAAVSAGVKGMRCLRITLTI